MKLILLIGTLLATIAFQACSGISFHRPDSQILKSEGNGDGYTGKPSPYNYKDPLAMCLEKGANGEPLPNAQIFVFPSGGVQLVRENCADIPPRPLLASEYSFDASGNIMYQNQVYQLTPIQTGFEIVAAACPAGRTLLPNPDRRSLIGAPVDLQSSAWAHQGLTVSLLGSLASLPLYQVQRTDPAMLEGWRRLNQSLNLNGNETYVFSFFAKPDANERLLFTSFFANYHDLRVEFDLSNGNAFVQSSSGIKTLTTQTTAFAGGLYINVYFELNANSPANIGIASVGTTLGSSVAATAVQLERVANFCAP